MGRTGKVGYARRSRTQTADRRGLSIGQSEIAEKNTGRARRRAVQGSHEKEDVMMRAFTIAMITLLSIFPTASAQDPGSPLRVFQRSGVEEPGSPLRVFQRSGVEEPGSPLRVFQRSGVEEPGSPLRVFQRSGVEEPGSPLRVFQRS